MKPELIDAREGRERADQTDVRTFRVFFDRADAAVVVSGGCRELRSPARSRDSLPGPRAERRRLWVSSASEFVWSINCESWLIEIKRTL